MIRSLFTNVQKINIFELIFAFITPVVIVFGVSALIFPFLMLMTWSDAPVSQESINGFAIFGYTVLSILYLISIFIPSFIIGWRHKSDKVFLSLFTTLFFSWILLYIFIQIVVFFGDKILTALHF